MTGQSDELSGPVYRSWDEAMADSGLDLGQSWYVAEIRPGKIVEDDDEWPDGWKELGYTEDGGKVYYRPAPQSEAGG